MKIKLLNKLINLYSKIKYNIQQRVMILQILEKSYLV
jgi:hypothetical protein